MGIIKTCKLVYEYIRRDENNEIAEKLQAIKGVDIDIEEGQFVAILGRNGSGKSTLAKHMNALFFPTDGTVWVGDMDTKDESHILDIRQTAGMVFQNPDNQIVSTIVEEDVGFGPENMGVPSKEIWKRVDESLKAVGMTAYRKDSPNHLSGAQKQRIAIAGVMAMRPRCIVLDEPTTGLDPQTRKLLWDVVSDLRRRENMTVFLTTHYMEEAADADYVVILDHGQIAAEGTPLQLKNAYTGDFITLYGVEEGAVRTLGMPYEKLRDAYRVSVPDTAAATRLILEHPALFSDYEITKGKMDEVFLAATGKRLQGGMDA